MSLLEALPVELLLQVIRYLPLQSMHRFARTSRGIRRIIVENEALVYRQAAVLHGYVDSVANVEPPDAHTKNSTYPFANATSWKQYCAWQTMDTSLSTSPLSSYDRSILLGA